MRGMISDYSLPNWHKSQKRPYKPQVGQRRAGDACHGPIADAASGPVSAINCLRIAPAPGRRHRKKVMDSLDSFKCLRPLKVGAKTYAYLQPAGGGEERLEGDFAAAVFAQGAAGKSAAQRGRPRRHQAGHPGRRAMAQDQDLGARNRVSAGARADAGFHRRAGGGRSRRHARRHGASRRRCEEDQSAGAG